MLRVAVTLALTSFAACGQDQTTNPAAASADANASNGDHDFISSADALRGQSLLPVRIDYLNNDIGFATTIYVGSTPLEVVIDTGSSGLRILEGAVPESEFVVPETGGHVSQAYGSGSVFSGPVATAYVTIAGLVTPTPIKVQRVQALSCTAAKPNCPSANTDPATHLIKGESGGTYRAVMGIGMRNGGLGVGSPIAQLPGAPAYILASNGPYGTTAGHIMIGPTTALRSLFTPMYLPQTGGPTLESGVPAYDDRSINVCVINYTSAKTFCAPALLDSGAAQTTITFQGAATPHAIPSGSYVEYDYRASSSPTAPIVAFFDLEVSDAPQPGLDAISIVPTSDASSMNTGTITFFNTRVLFDQANGIMGLAAPAW